MSQADSRDVAAQVTAGNRLRSAGGLRLLMSRGRRTTRSLRRIAAFVAVSVLATACEQAATTSRPSSTTEKPSDAGELIAFERVVAGAEDPDLYAVGLDGDEARLLRSPGGQPHWSPDGSQLSFVTCMNPPDCTTAVVLLERSSGDVHFFTFPDPELFTVCVVWAPSGKRLACEGYGEPDPKRNGLYSIRASDGRGLTRISSNPGGADIPLAYSPDGRQLLFSRALGGPAHEALFVTPISGGQPRRITPWGFTDDWASWSPDGRTIVFATNGYLYRVDPNGHGLAKIHLQWNESSARTAFDVSFAPDGRSIVFSLASPPGIYTARLDGSDVKQLTTTGPKGDHHASWVAASGP